MNTHTHTHTYIYTYVYNNLVYLQYPIYIRIPTEPVPLQSHFQWQHALAFHLTFSGIASHASQHRIWEELLLDLI